jgi:GGDEF domain-containing protein
LAVIYLNVDNFNIVNESLGHAAGEKLSGIVASRLVACVRESDTVAQRESSAKFAYA